MALLKEFEGLVLNFVVRAPASFLLFYFIMFVLLLTAYAQETEAVPKDWMVGSSSEPLTAGKSMLRAAVHLYIDSLVLSGSLSHLQSKGLAEESDGACHKHLIFLCSLEILYFF